MSATKFADIGKITNDLLNKDFPVGVVRVEAKGAEKTSQKVSSKFNALGTRDTTTGVLVGEVKNTLTVALTRPFAKEGAPRPLLLESTTTLGSLGTVAQQLELKDPCMKGLNVTTVGTVSQSGPAHVRVGLEYTKALSANAFLSSNSSMDLFKGPIVTHDTTLRCGELLFGGQVGYNVNKSKVENYSAAFGFDLPTYKASLHALNGCNTLTAAFYQKFSSGIETGYKATWNRKTASAFGIEVVSKFPIDPISSLKTKLDNSGKLGVSYSTQLNTKVSVILAGTFDTFKLEESGHRIGCGFVVDI